MVMVGQAIILNMKVQCAVQAGAQEALNNATWAADGTPSSGAYSPVELTMNACLNQMGLKELPSGAFTVPDPQPAGVPGRYAFSAKLSYPFSPTFGGISLPTFLSISGSASIINDPHKPHKIAWIYADQVPGDPCFPSADIQRGGIMVPIYGGSEVNPDGTETPLDGVPPPGTYTQYDLVLIGSYTGSVLQSY